MGQFDCTNQPAGFIDRFLVFGFWIAVGDNAASGLDIEHSVVRYHRSQGDTGIHIATVVDIADRTAIGAAAMGLDFVNDFHRTDFRRA